MIPAEGLIPFPSIDGSMFRRLEEAWRLYRIRPTPIVVSGGHVNPFTPAKDENRIARDYLIRWGVPKADVLGEGNSRDTFESAVEVEKLLPAERLETLSLGHIGRTHAAQHARFQSQSARSHPSARGFLAWQIRAGTFPFLSGRKRCAAESLYPCTSILDWSTTTGASIFPKTPEFHS